MISHTTKDAMEVSWTMLLNSSSTMVALIAKKITLTGRLIQPVILTGFVPSPNFLEE